jgi:hypothetical protein
MIAFAAILGLFILVFIWGIWNHLSVKELRKQLANYEKRYAWRVGASSFLGQGEKSSYRLFSLDGGKTWYAVDKDNQILGAAEQVHPGLLKHLDGMERFLDHVAEHKDIDPTTDEGRALLEGAGLTVTKT